MSTPASDPRLRPVAIREEARALSVDWQDGHQSHFHYVWLRDACRCRHCGEPAFGHKRTLAADIPADITTSSARLGNDGSVTLLWSPDGHESSFSGAWLQASTATPIQSGSAGARSLRYGIRAALQTRARST